VLNEQGIQRDPESFRDRPAEGLLGFFGSTGTYDSETVRDPMDMGVDRDRGDSVAEDENAVRGLRTDPAQAGQLLERAGNLAAEPVEELSRARSDDPRLHPIEPGGADQRLDLPRARTGEAGCVGKSSEQERARSVGVRVPRALREDRADQHLERVLRMVAQVRATPISGPVERAQPIEKAFPIDPGRAARRHARVLRPVVASSRVSVGWLTPGSERSGSSSESPLSRISSPIR